MESRRWPGVALAWRLALRIGEIPPRNFSGLSARRRAWECCICERFADAREVGRFST